MVGGIVFYKLPRGVCSKERCRPYFTRIILRVSEVPPEVNR